MLQCDLKSVLFQDISIYIIYISDYEIVKTKNIESEGPKDCNDAL